MNEMSAERAQELGAEWFHKNAKPAMKELGVYPYPLQFLWGAMCEAIRILGGNLSFHQPYEYEKFGKINLGDLSKMMVDEE